MTLLGKILVFLNLVMACLFLGFAVMVFQSRVNYQQQVADAKKDAGKARDEVSGIRLKYEEQKADALKLAGVVTDKDAALKKAQDEAVFTLTQLQQEVNRVNLQNAPLKQQLQNATEEMGRRKKEVDDLRTDREELLKRNSTLVDNLTTERDAHALAKNRLEDLTVRANAVEKENTQIRGWIASKGMTLPEIPDLMLGNQIPAPPEVKGVITQVDSSGKFLQISLGEDDGIKKGQILEIWRNKPAPKYVGTARITYTQARAAVAQPVKVTGLVLKDDEIGPKSMINR